jgi:hypothetical protein
MNITNLEAATFSKLLGVVSDVSLIIDQQGVIEDVSTGQDTMATLGCQSWMGKRWLDTVTVESRKKIEELLQVKADTSTLNCKILQLDPTPGNAVGAFANWHVVLNNHFYRGGTTGI